MTVLLNDKKLIISNAYDSRSLFGETTSNNNVVFTIDGDETFKLIYEVINQAKTTICITSYDIDPKLNLVKNPNSFQHNIQPTTSTSTSDIHLIDNIEKNSVKNTKNMSNDLFILENLLLQKAIEGVDIKILVWEPKFFIRKFPGSTSWGIGPRENKIKTLRNLAKSHGVESKINIRIDNMSPTYTSGFHEKLIIIDNKVGFCGGFDLMSDKWDTKKHNFDDPLRNNDYSPWHDVHFLITGPIVWDMIFHFNQRWVYSLTKNISKARNARVTTVSYDDSPVNLINDITNIEENVEIQAFRTWKNMDGGQDKEYISGVYSWYELLFKRATKNIYIEDQFPFQNYPITQVLGQQLKREKDLRVITVGPMNPNIPGFPLSIISKESINDINNNLSYLRKIGGERVNTYTLVSQDPSIPQKRRQIYVHSKLSIVDDCWMKIGSANMDKKGFYDSVEFDLGITSPQLSKKLRIKLWEEHLTQKKSSLYKVDLNDFESGFEAWIKIANDNGSRVQNNEPLDGHVYYYNFEEMNFPSPYVNAK